MAEARVAHTWQEELASLVEDNGIPYVGDSMEIPQPPFISPSPELFTVSGEEEEEEQEEEERTKESFKEQVSGFMKAWGEMLLDLGKGCKEIVEQTIVTEDSFIVQKFGKPIAKVSSRFGFLNEYLPEDRDPVHSWSVILSVFMLAFIVIGVSNTNDRSILRVKRVSIHPPTANKVLMPDGRQIAYQVVGVPVDRARFSLIFPHPFFFSRLAGIPGIKTSVLEEFGICLLTYDLPGFGESDPHPSRNLNSSALDLLHLANAVGINGKFWVLGYSSGSMHSWAALRYIPDRIAGAAMFSPMINPYDPRLTKDEMRRTWDLWLPRRKFLYFLARKFPSFLSSFYKRSFLSGYHGRLDRWMSLSLGRKDEILIEDPVFEAFWQRNVEELIRQRNSKPFIEEAVLQVSNWGFSLVDIQVQKKCPTNGILSWLKTMYSQAECELVGFLGPIHIWQGLNDSVAPPSMTDYISRILPEAILHKLPNEGHFSYLFFCDECHKQILTTLFGNPLGPLDPATVPEETADEEVKQASLVNGSAIE